MYAPPSICVAGASGCDSPREESIPLLIPSTYSIHMNGMELDGSGSPRLRGAVAPASASEPASDDAKAPRHAVCMVCDFFYPRLGGVEMHIWSQAQCLLAMGHKVVVVTSAVGARTGVRWMTNGLKVYYLPLLPFVDGNTLPTLGLAYFPLFRKILYREGITVVHVHQVC